MAWPTILPSLLARADRMIEEIMRAALTSET